MIGFIRKLNLKNELLAGLTVALAMIPEAIAFAFVAGIDPLIGLHTSLVIGIIAAIFGGRPGMISGAAGSVAVVFVALVARHGIEYLFATVVLMGLLQIMIGIFKLGKFARMIPYPVILGFVNGLAVVIFLAQLHQFKINGKWMSGIQFYAMLGLVILTMLIIYLLPKFTKVIPASLAGIIVTTVLAMWLNKIGIHMPDVKEFAKGGISGGLPQFHIPHLPLNFETLEIIFPFAITAALVGIIESLLTLSLIDDLTNTRGQGNRECIGQGLGNLLNGFMGGTGGCAMIGQSIVNITSNGRGRLSGVFMGLSLLSFVLFGSKIIEAIPLAALVGVMFMVVIETFAWDSLKLGKKVPTKDIVIIVIVAGVTIAYDLALAVITGVIISALIFAWEKGKEIRARILISGDGSKIYFLEGPLFFGSVTNFKEIFTPEEDPDKVYIDFASSNISDHSAIEAVNAITEKYEKLGKKIILKHLSPDCKILLENADKIIEVNVLEDPSYHIADDILG
jgi:SulP family sulfate permease